MATYRNTRLVPVILLILIIIIAVAALVSVARVVFFSGSSNSNPAVVDTSRENLLNTSLGHSVSMTVRGPIVADENFHTYQITVSPTTREIKTFNGYLDRRVDSKTLSNTVAGYEEFVYALEKANLSKGDELAGDKNDIRGLCASGKLYEFSILNNGDSVKTLWTTSCNSARGSLDGVLATYTGLFLKQIPDADKLTKAVKL